MDFTVGMLVITILVFILIGNTMYVYLDSGVFLNMFDAKTPRQAMTAMINIFCIMAIIAGAMIFAYLNWNTPLKL